MSNNRGSGNAATPVITTASGQDSGSVSEDGTLKATGRLSAVETGSSHPDLDWSVVGNGHGTYGSFSIDDNGKWSYALNNKSDAVQSLAAGEHVSETFNVRVSDGHGGLATETVTIDVVGTDDAPEITGGTSAGAVKEDGTLTASGHLNATDVDHGAQLSWSVVNGGAGAYGTLAVDQNGNWTYQLDNDSAAVQSLRGSDKVTETFVVKVTDEFGASDTQTVTVKIQGTDDAPIIVGTATGAVTEDGTVTASGQLSILEIDRHDNRHDDHRDDGHGSDDAHGDNHDHNSYDSHDSDDGSAWSVVGGGAGTYGTFSVDAAGQWTYILANGAANVQALSAGETHTETFTVQFRIGEHDEDDGHDDHAGHDAHDHDTPTYITQTVNVTVTGTNDAPVITSTVQSGAAQEDSVLTATGQVTASDIDHLDVLSYAVAGDGNGTYGSLAVDSSTGQWTYTLNNGAANVQALSEGETHTETFTVLVSDGNGGTTSQDVNITVTSTNDAPVITSADQVGAAQEDAVLTATGQVTASDVDHLDTLSYAVVGDGNGAYGSLAIDSGTGAWTYTLNNGAANVQALSAGESHNETFTVQVSDGHGGTTSQDVVVSVTGTNDVPVVTSSAQAGAVQEDSVLIATGQVTASDIDHLDTLSFSGNANGTYGAFAVDSATGTWTYTLNNNAANVQALSAGESHNETFTVQVSDGHGGITSQDVVVTVTGTNDAPVITSAAQVGAAQEDSVLTTAGQVTASDVDNGAVLSYAVVGDGNGTYGSLAVDSVTGQWTYNLNNNDPTVQALAQGESHVETFTVQVSDGLGGITSQDVAVTVTGTNDAPAITGGTTTGNVTEDTISQASGQIQAFDPDHGATQNWTVTGGSGSASADYHFAIDTFTVTGNIPGGTFQDTFSDGVSPPSLPTGTIGYGGSYGGIGGFTESGGKALLDSANAVSFVGNGNPDPVIGQDAILKTNIDPTQTTSGLKEATNFNVSGVFDLAVPDSPREAYGIRLTDRLIGGPGNPPDQLGDDTYELVVRQGTQGHDFVSLRQLNFATNITTNVQSFALNAPVGADQIVLSMHHNANDAFATASFQFLSAGVVDGPAQNFTAHADIFGTAPGSVDTENWTRAEFVAYAPATTDSLLSGTYGTLDVNQSGNWTYNLDETRVATQALAQGQTATDTFMVQVADQFGATASTPVTITVTGTNDAPVMQTASVSRALAEDSNVDGSGNLNATGLAQFSDVDLTDTHTTSAHLVSSTLSDGGSLPAGLSTLLANAMSESIVDPATGDGHGQVQWNFALADSAAQFLAVGQTLTLGYDLNVTDTFGAVATQHVTVTVTGTNDAPVISGTATGSVAESDPNPFSLDAPSAYSVGPVHTSPFTLAVADVNGDGKVDVVTANEDGNSLSVLLNDGSGGFGSPTIYGSGGAFPRGVAVADVNGDGHADIVVSNFDSSTLGVLLNNGSGGFGSPTLYSAGATGPHGVVLADVNGDGNADIVTPDYYSNTVSVLLNNGSGGFAAPSVYSVGAANPFSVAVADVNGDGKADMVTADYGSNAVSVLLNNGSGSFGPAVAYSLGGSNPYSVAVADVNGDGKADVVAVDSTSNSVSVLLNDGSGGFGASIEYNIGGGADSYSVALADMNGDGKADIVVGHQLSDTVSVLLNDGSGGFGAPILYNVGASGPAGVALADVNGDGKTDILVTDIASNAVSVLINGTGSNATTTGTLTATDVDTGATQAWSIQGSANGAYGSLALTGNTGQWTYTLNNAAANVQALAQGQTVQDTFTVQVDDSHGGIATQEVDVTVTGTNDAPVAANVSATADQNTPVTLGLNYYDPDTTDTDTVTLFETVNFSSSGSLGGSTEHDVTDGYLQQGGHAVLNADGTVTFDPGHDFDYLGAGQTQDVVFDYRVTDSFGATTTATIDVTVTGENDAPVAYNTTATADQNTPTTVYLPWYEPDQNDTDTVTLFESFGGSSASSGYFGDSSAGSFGGSEHDVTDGYLYQGGHAQLNADGTVTFDPGHSFDYLGVGQTMDVVFDYRVTDSYGATSTATIDVTVTGENDAPVAFDAAATADQNTPVTFGLSHYEPDQNDTDTVTLFETVNFSSSGSLGGSTEHDVTDGYLQQGGHAVLNADGTVTFDPGHDFDYLGAGQTQDVVFDYRVTDSFGATTTATIDVTVTGENDAPVIISSAQDATGAVQAVHPSTTFSGTVTADNQFAIYVSSNDSQLGTLLGTGNDWGHPFVFNAATLTQGTTNYIHVVATNVGGPGGFVGSFSLSDSNFAFANGSTVENTTAADWNVSLTGFGGNYQAPVNEGVNTVGVTPWSPLSGISSSSNWMWSYDSHNGGNDTFTEYFSMQISSVNPSATGHLTASDVDTGATQSWSVVGSATGAYGALAVDANTGVWSYALDNNSSAVVALGAGQTADDSFTVRVTDDHGATADQVVTVHVTGINDAPTAVADTTTTDQNTPKTIDVLANDTDPDSGDTLTLINVSIAGDAQGRTGTASIVNNQVVFNQNTQFISLGVGQSTTNVVTYTISDGHGGTSTATDTITVTGINDAPVAIADTATTTQNQAVAFNVLANDIDQDSGDVLTITNAGLLLGDAQGRTGTVSIVNNQVVFDPNGQFASLAQGQSTTNLMFYTVSDGHGGISQAVDTITVTGTNDAPVVASGGDTSGAVLVNTTETAAGQLSASDVDNGAALGWSVENSGAGTYGTLAVDQTGHWTYTLDNSAAAVQAIPDGQHVADSFLVDVTDEFGATATETVAIDITGAHVADPIVASDGLTVNAIAGGIGVNGTAGTSSLGGAGTVGGNGTAGSDGSMLDVVYTAQILNGDTGNDTLAMTLIANGATGGTGGIGGIGGDSNPYVSASSNSNTYYNSQGYPYQFNYYTTYDEYVNYSGASGGAGGAGGSASSMSATAQLDIISGSGGADSLTLDVESNGANGGTGGDGGAGGNTGPDGYYDYSYLSGYTYTQTGYYSYWVSSGWGGGYYQYQAVYGNVPDYQYVTTNYHVGSGVFGGAGGDGGAGGNGSDSVAQSLNNSVSGGDGNDTILASVVALAGNGGHGGNGGMGGYGPDQNGGIGGHGGDGGMGGDASAVLVGNTLDGGAGDDTVTLSAVATAGAGGDGGNGGTAGLGQYVAYYNGGTTTFYSATGGAGGDGGAFGTASIDVNGNVLNGGDGNDVLTLSATLTGGTSGAGGTGGGAGTSSSYSISDTYGTHTYQYVAGVVGSGGGTIGNSAGDQISIVGNMLSGGNGDDTLKLTIDATNAHNLSVTVDGNIFDGGAGNNTLDLSHIDVAGVSVDLGSGVFTVDGAAGTNTLLNIQSVIGTSFGDTLAGNGFGETLFGGGGNDLFAFHANGNGNNNVGDFQSGVDFIELIGTGFTSAADALAHTVDDGHGNAVIQIDAHDTVTIANMLVASLHASDYLLA